MEEETQYSPGQIVDLAIHNSSIIMPDNPLHPDFYNNLGSPEIYFPDLGEGTITGLGINDPAFASLAWFV